MKPLSIFGFYKSAFREAPARMILMGTLVILAGVLEGLGFTLFLPLIRSFTSGGALTSNSADSKGLFDGLLEFLSLKSSMPMLFILIIGVFAVKNAILYVSRIIAGHISADFEINLRRRLITSLFATDWSFFHKEKMGALVGAMEAQATKSGQGFRLLAQLHPEIFSLVICCAVGLFLSWQTFLLSFVAGGICFLSTRKIINLSRKVAAKSVDITNESYRLIDESFSGIKFIKGNAVETDRRSAIFDVLENLRSNQIKTHRYLAAVDTLFDFIMAIFLSLILYVAHFHFKVPGANILVVSMLLYRINKVILAIQVKRQLLTSNVPAYEFCQQILKKAENTKELSGAKVFTTLRTGIIFDSVSFRYTEPVVLSSVSLEIKKNSVTALVGRSGSGKTTALDLVLGLLKPQSGSILLDGCTLDQYDIHSWRKSVGYVPQEPFLMNGTVEENIRLGNPKLTTEDIRKAAQTAHADEFIERMPDKYQALVGQRGAKLSGGQRQRLALARALARKPSLLILDEATSSLDNESERYIQHAIRELKGSLTILIVAHRSATIEPADIIYVLDEGRITGSGAIEDLRIDSEVFKRLYTESSNK